MRVSENAVVKILESKSKKLQDVKCKFFTLHTMQAYKWVDV
jgi:hypothetical protein